MKALKEKRINLRSLWRRSLVILSLLALVLAACGDSDSGDSSGSTTLPGRVVVSAELLNFPYHAPDGTWGKFEGTPVDLRGVQVRVTYQGGGEDRREIIEDVRNFSITPPIYMLNRDAATLGPSYAQTYGGVAREDGTDIYQLTFVMGNFVQSWSIYNGLATDSKFATYPAANFAIGNVQPLIDAVNVRDLAKQEYRVDEDVDLRGASIFGFYGNPVASRDDWHRVELTGYMDHYQWRWVWNDAANYADQNPGVLLRIGTWGSFRRGDATPNTTPTAGTALTGLRIPVRRLWQVESIDFVGTLNWSTIFVDDPRYIGTALEGFRLENWTQDALAGARLRVRYIGTSLESEIELKDIPGMFLTPHWSNAFAAGNSLDGVGSWQSGLDWNVWDGNQGSGKWDEPQLLFFLDTAYPTMDGESGSTDPQGFVRDFKGVVKHNGLWFNQGYGPGGPTSDNATRTREDWVTWIDEGHMFGVEYRGVYTPARPVPLYTTLDTPGLSVTAIPAGSTVIMDGGDRVDRGPDREPQFLSRINISLTYQLAGTASDYSPSNPPATAIRGDVLADLRNGRMRGVVPNGFAGITGQNHPNAYYGVTTDVQLDNGDLNTDIFNAEFSGIFVANPTDPASLQPVTVSVFVYDPVWEELDNRETTFNVGQRNYRAAN